MGTETQEQSKIAPEAAKQKYPFKAETPCTDDCARRFLEAFATVLRHTNYKYALDTYARVGVHCGRCADMCQVYQASQDVKDIPFARTNLLLKVYKRYFTLSGHLKARAINTYELTDPDIDALVESMYRCTTCERCNLECPMGIDHALMTRLGRYILSEMRIIPKALQAAVRNQVEGDTKNISGMSLPALKDTLEFLEEDIEELTGRKIAFPVGKKNVDYVFFPPVTDFMAEAETLMGHAAVMDAMGLADNWTFGDINYDAKNYGYYYSDWIFERIVKEIEAETRRLNGKYILLGECGHALRACRLGLPLFGSDNPPPVVSSIELLYTGLKDGKIKFDPGAIKEKVTYHDPCNFGRKSGIIDEPRYIIKQMAGNFVEMKPGGKYNYCCGAGPASMDDIKEFRMEVSGKLKAEQLKKTGADIVVAPCANCKKQIGELIEHYKLPMERKGLHDLALKAIAWE